MISKKKQLIGAHMSISGGLEKAIESGDIIGCTAVQLFTKNNRQWHAQPISFAQSTLFKTTLKNATNVKIAVAHGCYLINLVSDNPQTREKSLNAIIDELNRCDILGIPHLVVHPGSSSNKNKEEVLTLLAEQINKALEKTTSKTMLLLETMAGQGGTIGNTFEQLAFAHKKIHQKKRVGFCLDTCHVFAAGYDLTTLAGYKTMWQLFDTIIGIENLHLIHINDSKQDCNSRVDRHADIGKGKLGLETFSRLLHDPILINVPKILETPHQSLEDDARNLETLKSLL